jgi:hypothetical protein
MPGTSMNYATAIAIITPKVGGFPPLAIKADTFFNEEEFLAEPQPARDRARQFMSNDGETVQYIDIFAIAGKRDVTLLDGDLTDLFISQAMSNPQPLFDFAFTYQRNDQDASKIRTQNHIDCKIMNHPVRALSNDIAVVKFTLAYAKIQLLDFTGNPV